MMGGENLLLTSRVQHKIPIKEDQHPINQMGYPLPQVHEEEIHQLASDLPK